MDLNIENLKKELKKELKEDLKNDIQGEILNHFTKYPSGAKLWIDDDALKPRRAYDDDAGLDITLQQDAVIMPGKTIYLKAKLGMDLPPHICGLVVTRSGSPRKDILIIPTLIDSSYKNEISNIISNISSEPVHLKKGDKVSQVILLPKYIFENEDGLVETLEKVRPENHKHGSSDQ